MPLKNGNVKTRRNDKEKRKKGAHTRSKKPLKGWKRNERDDRKRRRGGKQKHGVKRRRGGGN